MRLLAALVILFIAIVASGFWMNHRLEATTVRLLEEIEEIDGQIRANNWERAHSQAAALKRTWKKEAGWWPMVLDHQEMDNIEFALARFEQYVLTKNTSLSRGQLSELRLMIRHIPEKEAINIGNIL